MRRESWVGCRQYSSNPGSALAIDHSGVDTTILPRWMRSYYDCRAAWSIAQTEYGGRRRGRRSATRTKGSTAGKSRGKVIAESVVRLASQHRAATESRADRALDPLFALRLCHRPLFASCSPLRAPAAVRARHKSARVLATKKGMRKRCVFFCPCLSLSL